MFRLNRLVFILLFICSITNTFAQDKIVLSDSSISIKCVEYSLYDTLGNIIDDSIDPKNIDCLKMNVTFNNREKDNGENCDIIFRISINGSTIESKTAFENLTLYSTEFQYNSKNKDFMLNLNYNDLFVESLPQKGNWKIEFFMKSDTELILLHKDEALVIF